MSAVPKAMANDGRATVSSTRQLERPPRRSTRVLLMKAVMTGPFSVSVGGLLRDRRLRLADRNGARAKVVARPDFEREMAPGELVLARAASRDELDRALRGDHVVLAVV